MKQNAKDKFAGFEVDIPQFDGPFETMLSLISTKKLDLSIVSLSKITDEFIQFSNKLLLQSDSSNPEGINAISDFLYISAILLRIKSALLLNRDDDNELFTDIEILRERDLLFAKLLQYKAYKNVAFDLETAFQEAKPRYAHSGNQKFLDDSEKNKIETKLETNLEQLAQIAAAAISRMRISTEHLHIHKVDIEKERQKTMRKISKNAKFSFSELIDDTEKIEIVIVRFMILLDLYKEKIIDLQQDSPFADFTIRAL